MKALRVYIDTSVAGGCFEDEFAEPSCALFDMVRNRRITLLLSDLLAIELQRAPEEVHRVVDDLPPVCVERLLMSGESRSLHRAYLKAKVVGPKHAADAHHIALATVARADLMVSWNFRHIVHYDKIRLFNAVNLREGYQTIEIRSPREVV